MTRAGWLKPAVASVGSNSKAAGPRAWTDIDRVAVAAVADTESERDGYYQYSASGGVRVRVVMGGSATQIGSRQYPSETRGMAHALNPTAEPSPVIV